MCDTAHKAVEHFDWFTADSKNRKHCFTVVCGLFSF